MVSWRPKVNIKAKTFDHKFEEVLNNDNTIVKHPSFMKNIYMFHGTLGKIKGED